MFLIQHIVSVLQKYSKLIKISTLCGFMYTTPPGKKVWFTCVVELIATSNNWLFWYRFTANTQEMQQCNTVDIFCIFLLLLFCVLIRISHSLPCLCLCSFLYLWLVKFKCMNVYRAVLFIIFFFINITFHWTGNFYCGYFNNQWMKNVYIK